MKYTTSFDFYDRSNIIITIDGINCGGYDLNLTTMTEMIRLAEMRFEKIQEVSNG